MSDNENQISERASELAADVIDSLGIEDEETKQSIRERADELFEYHIGEDEVRRSLFRSYGDDESMPTNEPENADGPADPVPVASISEHHTEGPEDDFIDVEVKVVNSDMGWNMHQAAKVGDDSGTTVFKLFDEEVEPLAEGESYVLKNVVTDEYNGNYSVQHHDDHTEVEKVDAEIEVADDSGADTETFVTPIIKQFDQSGLVERCPEEDCSRVLSNDRCSEHGAVDGEYDLRVKGLIDPVDGVPRRVFFGTDQTEEILGMTVEEAVEEAKAEMDNSVIRDYLNDELLGKFYRLEGATFTDNNGNPGLSVYEYEEYDDREEIDAQANELLSRALGV